MEIKYLNCDGKKKLFSFHRHDYATWKDGDREYMLDGGEDYTRHSLIGTLEWAEISEVIEDIREQFKWTKKYDKDNNLLPQPVTDYLKNLEDGHLLGILKYLLEQGPYFTLTKMVILEEIIYRRKNNIII